MNIIPHLAIVVAVVGAAPAGAQGRVLFDARMPERAPGHATRAEAALLRREIAPVARGLWRGNDECAGGIHVQDVAQGAFTRPGAAQRAILYEWCQTAAIFAFGGVVVVERGRVVAHAVYAYTTPGDLARVPDFTGDGRDDLVLSVDGHTAGGSSELFVTTLSLPPGRAVSHTFLARDDDCGRESDPAARDTARVTYVVPGARPRFSQRRYVSACTLPKRYVAHGAAAPAVAAGDVGFRRLR